MVRYCSASTTGTSGSCAVAGLNWVTTLADTVARELREETGLTVVHADIDLIDFELFSPVAGTLVALVCYRVTVSPGSIAELRGSDEHVELRFFSADALPPHLPAVYRRFINAAVR